MVNLDEAATWLLPLSDQLGSQPGQSRGDFLMYSDARHLVATYRTAVHRAWGLGPLDREVSILATAAY